MQDSEERLVQGRTRWRRFAAMMVPTTVVAGAIVAGMANGAIAASFAVSGQTFKVSASKLIGDGFVQYGGGVAEVGGAQHVVTVSGIRQARLYDLCQSVEVPHTPLVLRIEAGGGGNPARATDMLIDMDELRGQATFTNIEIGRDASTLDAGPEGATGPAKTFGQQADRVVITDLKQVARSTSAGTFTLNGLSLKFSGQPCFN